MCLFHSSKPKATFKFVLPCHQVNSWIMAELLLLLTLQDELARCAQTLRREITVNTTVELYVTFDNHRQVYYTRVDLKFAIQIVGERTYII